MGVGEDHSFLGQEIDVRRGNLRGLGGEAMNVSIAQIIAKDENHVWLPERRKVKKKEYKKAGNESLHEYPIILRREREQEESVEK